MLSYYYTFILLHILLNYILISHCFLQNNILNNRKLLDYKNKWYIYATKSKLKAVRKFTRDRPKKTTPAAIYPSPTLYYGNVHNHFGAPPEYLAIPVDKTLNILRNGKLSELISHLKKGITGKELSEVLSNKSFYNELLNEISTIKEISEYEDCDVSSDLYMYFNSILKSPLDYEHYIDKFYTLKKLHSYWERKEELLYNTMRNRLFTRLKNIAYRMRDAGIPLEEFSEPRLWHRYGVFKLVPNCKMVDNYLEKHKIALNYNIKSLYYRNPKTNEIISNFQKFYTELNNKNNGEDENVSQTEDAAPEQQQENNGEQQTNDLINNNNVDVNNNNNVENPSNNLELNSNDENKEDSYSLYPDDINDTEQLFTLDENGKLPKDLVDRIVNDLAELGVLDQKQPWTINLSKIDQLQEEFITQEAQHAYAIRDYYLSYKYPDYKIESDPYKLESYLNHDYRTKTYERDLLYKYKTWLKLGAPRDTFKPMNLKYEHLAIWHGLSKNQRRRLAQKYVKTLTTSVNK